MVTIAMELLRVEVNWVNNIKTYLEQDSQKMISLSHLRGVLSLAGADHMNAQCGMADSLKGYVILGSQLSETCSGR